ncbi:TetR/AcrR family transcriptional regulator [Nonomuraea sp. NPDC050556]|uniref:TetR/AcrR family transcriptional regulator n=1 Tax=Nonomuraea sp. NPDC050556 TaxID=3364369 RepID=UPI0037B9D56C
MARAGLTAERVTRAAAELADEVGFENITVSALARRFGVKDASLYSHVRNLQDLRDRVTVLAALEQGELVTDAVAGRSGFDALTAFAGAYRAYALAHPGRYTATHVQISPDLIAATPGIARGGQTVYALLQGYGLAEPDITDAVRLLRSTFHGFVTLEAVGGFGAPRDLDTSWSRILTALDHTLTTWNSPS